MAEFAPNKPVVMREPTVDVDKGLPAGQHVFQLQVEDNLGQLSAATQVTVIIFRQIGIGGIFLRFKPPG
ncbi:MAG TPA: hypothetical protein VF735_13465 [Pyrinomonadaceae bacterium]|jgi:hypothetical protein